MSIKDKSKLPFIAWGTKGFEFWTLLSLILNQNKSWYDLDGFVEATRNPGRLCDRAAWVADWSFCLPYIQGLLAMLDPNGSAVAAGSATSTIGGAIGPGLAATVIGSGVYQHIFMFAIGMLLFALMCFFISGRHTARP